MESYSQRNDTHYLLCIWRVLCNASNCPDYEQQQSKNLPKFLVSFCIGWMSDSHTPKRLQTSYYYLDHTYRPMLEKLILPNSM